MIHAIEPLTATTQASHAALRALWDIQTAFLRKSAYLQFSLAAIGFEGGVRQWQFFNTLIERDALIAGQKEIAESFQPRLSAITREAADTLRAFGGECMAWMLGAVTTDAATARTPASRPKPRSAIRRTSRKKQA